jgi:DNA (cytosine-5)-methyltransferase 1
MTTQSFARRAKSVGGGERKPRLLDLFCGQGGAAAGYHRAGFDVVGVDLAMKRQPDGSYVDDPAIPARYPFEFIKGDALAALACVINGSWRFDAIHASPPCQDHSATRDLGGHHGTDWLLAATRERLRATGLPWVLENVQGAPLPHQADLFGANGLVLCGCMFPELRGLLYEDRVFETSMPVPQPPHVLHQWRQTKMGRPPVPGECMQLTGHFTDAAEGRRRMSAEWMTRDGLAQAIPPAYTEHIGRQLLAHLAERAA